MAGKFGASVVIDRPIEEVFAYLADGTRDREFSPRVLEIEKRPDGPSAVGTVFTSTVKDAGVKTKREIELTEVDAPRRIRWAERSKNKVTAPEGGYDLEPEGEGTRLTFFNVLEGHGFGKLLEPLAVKAARKDADAFAQRIKAAVETR
jgi:uncharacterized protein YndB with AHSA1/START domain